RRRFSQRRGPGCVAVDAAAATGSWRPAARDVVMRIRADAEPSRVLVDRTPLARSAAGGSGAPGWSSGEDGFVEVRMRDRADAMSVTLESPGAPQGAGRSAAAASACAR